MGNPGTATRTRSSVSPLSLKTCTFILKGSKRKKKNTHVYNLPWYTKVQPAPRQTVDCSLAKDTKNIVRAHENSGYTLGLEFISAQTSTGTQRAPTHDIPRLQNTVDLEFRPHPLRDSDGFHPTHDACYDRGNTFWGSFFFPNFGTPKPKIVGKSFLLTTGTQRASTHYIPRLQNTVHLEFRPHPR